MKGFFIMKTTCELCEKETINKVSYLELETWEFDFSKNEKKISTRFVLNALINIRIILLTKKWILI